MGELVEALIEIDSLMRELGAGNEADQHKAFLAKMLPGVE